MLGMSSYFFIASSPIYTLWSWVIVPVRVTSIGQVNMFKTYFYPVLLCERRKTLREQLHKECRYEDTKNTIPKLKIKLLEMNWNVVKINQTTNQSKFLFWMWSWAVALKKIIHQFHQSYLCYEFPVSDGVKAVEYTDRIPAEE